jgi:amino-acid N-acetyltransferase
MTVIGIRRAVTDDLPAMKTLVDWGAGLGELVPQTFSALKSRVEHFLVATDEDHVIGVCALRPVDHEAGELCSLVIRPDYQRRGLGGASSKHAWPWLVGRGCGWLSR